MGALLKGIDIGKMFFHKLFRLCLFPPCSQELVKLFLKGNGFSHGFSFIFLQIFFRNKTKSDFFGLGTFKEAPGIGH